MKKFSLHFTKAAVAGFWRTKIVSLFRLMDPTVQVQILSAEGCRLEIAVESEEYKEKKLVESCFSNNLTEQSEKDPQVEEKTEKPEQKVQASVAVSTTEEELSHQTEKSSGAEVKPELNGVGWKSGTRNKSKEQKDTEHQAAELRRQANALLKDASVISALYWGTKFPAPARGISRISRKAYFP